MSELKYYKLFHRASALTSPEFLSVVEFGNNDEVYLKSEADKVIAELEMKLAIAQQVLRLNKPEALYSNLETMSRLTHEKYVIERRERHHKFKRCLNNAWWLLREEFFAEDCHCEHWVDWAIKWHKRWLELAEKFKDKEA